jgi:hypothetical protein
MAANSICLSPNGQYIRNEASADAAGILPGHLLIETATGVAVNATADDVPVRALFADINIGDAGDITRPYTSGENVHYVSASKGVLVNAILADGETIAVGDEIASAGGGEVKAPASAGVGVLGYAKEAVTTSGATAFITIQLL